MNTKRLSAIVAVLIVGAVLLVVQAQRPETPRPGEQDPDALNNAPQKQYPVFTLEAQQQAMKRIEEARNRSRIKDLRKNIEPADWIRYSYHGLLLDANLEVIEPTPDTVAKIQKSIFTVLQNSARTESTKTRSRALKSALIDSSFPGQEELLARRVAVDSLLAQSDPQLQSRYGWRIRLLRGFTRIGAASTTAISSKLSRRLQELQLSVDLVRPAPPPAQSTYVEACRAQSVPIPPDWPDARWLSQGPLALVFISNDLNAEVFTYRDPDVPGVCYALPRRLNGSIQLLGIICQSATTGRACFWDNKTQDTDTGITGPNITLDIDMIGNGMTLGENCTECHRGDNVFTIHPGTALDLSRADVVGGPYRTDIVDASGVPLRYTPIGQPHWVNPPALTLTPPGAGQRSCVVCHSLPEPSEKYCGSVLRMAATETMPPFGARANWPPDPIRPQFTDHIGQLVARCMELLP